MKNSKNIFSIVVYSFLLFFLNCCTSSKDNKIPHQEDRSGDLKIGWASADITPDQPVLIAGQFHARVSEGIMDSVTATVLALESGEGERSEKILLISCDLVSVNDGNRLRDSNGDNLRDVVRKKITDKIPALSPGQIMLNATHTHTAPYCSPAKDAKEIYGVELEVMAPDECINFISDRISEAAGQAWKNRVPGGISYGLGHAVVGHNRLQVSLSGKSQMYGNTNRGDFSHIEGYEDHAVNLLYTWDNQNNLTGIVINVACPSQVTEGLYKISADYWHDTRGEIRKRLGKSIFILPQCSAAGDQSPHLMVGEKAEKRMQQLMFPGNIETGDRTIGLRKQIAIQIADAVTSVLPYMRNIIDRAPVLTHRMEIVGLSRRLIDLEDVNNAVAEGKQWKEQYEKMLREVEKNPAIKQKPRWYRDITIAYTRMKRGNSVRERYELEKVQPKMPIEVHVLRIGDIVMATNPFELYLDYGMRIKARSPATQTFLVQLSGSGSYVPTVRSIAGGAYGAVPASTLVGPEGGQELVEKTLEMINDVLK